jgi:hypothetical protein
MHDHLARMIARSCVSPTILQNLNPLSRNTISYLKYLKIFFKCSKIFVTRFARIKAVLNNSHARLDFRLSLPPHHDAMRDLKINS